MTVDRAYRVLGLSATATEKELISNYRNLVKRVHPDFNAHRREWSHKAMTAINLAYETVRAYLADELETTRRGFQDTAPHGSADSGAHSKSAHAGQNPGQSGGGPRQSAGYRESSWASASPPEEPSAFSVRFEPAINAILDGMYLYYQYGLENIHLRHEGVRRFRYRSAMKQLQAGIERLEELRSLPKTDEETEHFALFRDFSKTFLQNMRIDKYYIPQRMPGEYKAYQHYANGCSHLDSAIKDRFFEDLASSFHSRSIAGGLKISHHEFMTVLVKYANSTWIPETTIKIYLLQLFEKVSQLDLAG